MLKAIELIEKDSIPNIEFSVSTYYSTMPWEIEKKLLSEFELYKRSYPEIVNKYIIKD